MFRFFKDLFRRKPEPSCPQGQGWQVVDPTTRIEDSPYTFFVPTDAEKEALEPGDLVKLIFEATGPETGSVERMWVVFEGRDGNTCFGKLSNQPLDIPGLSLHDPVRFSRRHIIAVYGTRVADPETEAKERFCFSRCRVDPAIIDGTARIGAIERYDPESVSGIADPDTGWYIFAEGRPSPDRDDMQCVAIGVVLNTDDSILPYLDAPTGTKLRRAQNGTFAGH